MTEKRTISASDLELREITWAAPESTRAALEAREAVHPLAKGDLQDKRLSPFPGLAMDKHCYGLFAPGSDTPEITVYVALKHLPDDAPNRDLPGDIDTILNKPVGYIEHPNTAIFYSITNGSLNPDGTPTAHHPIHVTKSVEGYTAGEELIRRVASRLGRLGIDHFSTLSPLRRGTNDHSTGFAQWLDNACQHTDTHPLFTPLEKQALTDIAPTPIEAFHQYRDAPETLAHNDQAFIEQLLKNLAITYLAHEKSPARERITRDQVAHFHLSNGAEIANIHIRPRGQCTESDARGAYGVMVNYRYDPAQIDARRAAYSEHGIIALDPELATYDRERRENLTAPTAKVEAATQHTPIKESPAPGQERT